VALCALGTADDDAYEPVVAKTAVTRINEDEDEDEEKEAKKPAAGVRRSRRRGDLTSLDQKPNTHARVSACPFLCGATTRS
jgi:hypothetical protein